MAIRGLGVELRPLGPRGESFTRSTMHSSEATAPPWGVCWSSMSEKMRSWRRTLKGGEVETEFIETADIQDILIAEALFGLFLVSL